MSRKLYRQTVFMDAKKDYNRGVKKDEKEAIRRIAMTEGFTTITMEPGKHIALVAHDNRKQDLIAWAMEH